MITNETRDKLIFHKNENINPFVFRLKVLSHVSLDGFLTSYG